MATTSVNEPFDLEKLLGEISGLRSAIEGSGATAIAGIDNLMTNVLPSFKKDIKEMTGEREGLVKKLYGEKIRGLEGLVGEYETMERQGRDRALLGALAIPFSTTLADRQADKAAEKKRKAISPGFNMMSKASSQAVGEIGRIGHLMNQFAGVPPKAKSIGRSALGASTRAGMSEHGQAAVLASKVAGRLAETLEKEKLARGRAAGAQDTLKFHAQKVVGTKRADEKLKGGRVLQAKEAIIQQAADDAYNNTMGIVTNIVEIASAIMTMTGTGLGSVAGALGDAGAAVGEATGLDNLLFKYVNPM